MTDETTCSYEVLFKKAKHSEKKDSASIQGMIEGQGTQQVTW